MFFSLFLSFFVFVLLCCQARKYAETLENAVWTNQFDNRANRKTHYETTTPEIWQQTSGRGYSDVEKCWGTLVCFKIIIIRHWLTDYN